MDFPLNLLLNKSSNSPIIIYYLHFLLSHDLIYFLIFISKINNYYSFMSIYIEKKQEKVANISKLIHDSQSFLTFEFHFLDVETLTALRKKLIQFNSKIIINKNNILKRSLLESKKITTLNNLKNKNGILISNIKDIEPLKLLFNNGDKNKKLELIPKFAYFDNYLFDEKNIHVLVNLQSKEKMFFTCISLLLQTICKLLFILKNIKK